MRYWMLILLLGLSQVACNTIEGVGEDIESAGEEIAEEADEARD